MSYESASVLHLHQYNLHCFGFSDNWLCNPEHNAIKILPQNDAVAG